MTIEQAINELSTEDLLEQIKLSAAFFNALLCCLEHSHRVSYENLEEAIHPYSDTSLAELQHLTYMLSIP